MNTSRFKKLCIVPIFLLFLLSAFQTAFRYKHNLYSFGFAFYPYVFTNEIFFINNSVTAQLEDKKQVKLTNLQIFGANRPISINGDTYYCITRFHLLEKNFCAVVFEKICKKAQADFSVKIDKLVIELDYEIKKIRAYVCEK